MKLLKFTEFVNEELDTAKLAELSSTIEDIDFLVKSGLIADSVASSKLSQLNREFFQVIKSSGALTGKKAEDIEILKDLGKSTGNACLKALTSDGAKALMDKGLYMVSSITQLTNGTIVWSLDKNYQRSNGWGIGFFGGSKIVRRMTPKGIYVGVYGRTVGSMDVKIKDFDKIAAPGLDFYNKAMLWAAENIDFETAALNPEPTAWKYYKKKKGQTAKPRSSREEVWAKAEELRSKGLTTLRLLKTKDYYGYNVVKNAPELIQAREYIIQSIKMKLDWIGDTQDPVYSAQRHHLTQELGVQELEIGHLKGLLNDATQSKTTQPNENN